MISDDKLRESLFTFALRNGYDRLILGHRVSEWCGHAPILEEDIALSNFALDLIGQASLWLQYAAEMEGKSRTEDDLVFLQKERDFTNLLLVEQSNIDFAYTLARQFYFDVYDYFFYNELKNSKDETLVGIAEKSLKESTYHLRHSSEWMLRLGDGTELSHEKIQTAADDLWMYTGEMFESDDVDNFLLKEGYGVDLAKIKPLWYENISKIFSEATLNLQSNDAFMQKGGRQGRHTENLGHILNDMQYLAGAYPGAKW